MASAAERLAWDQQQNSQQDTADPAEEEAALESDNEIQDQDEGEDIMLWRLVMLFRLTQFTRFRIIYSML